MKSTFDAFVGSCYLKLGPIVHWRVTVTQSHGDGDHMGEVTAGVTTKQTANKTEESDLGNHNSLPTMMEQWSIKEHAKYTRACMSST